MFRIQLDALYQSFIAIQMMGGDGTMNRLAVDAVVAGGHIGGDQLALTWGKRVGATQQYFHQLIDGVRRLRPELHQASNAGKSFG